MMMMMMMMIIHPVSHPPKIGEIVYSYSGRERLVGIIMSYVPLVGIIMSYVLFLSEMTHNAFILL